MGLEMLGGYAVYVRCSGIFLYLVVLLRKATATEALREIDVLGAQGLGPCPVPFSL